MLWGLPTASVDHQAFVYSSVFKTDWYIDGVSRALVVYTPWDPLKEYFIDSDRPDVIEVPADLRADPLKPYTKNISSNQLQQRYVDWNIHDAITVGWNTFVDFFSWTNPLTCALLAVIGLLLVVVVQLVVAKRKLQRENLLQTVAMQQFYYQLLQLQLPPPPPPRRHPPPPPPRRQEQAPPLHGRPPLPPRPRQGQAPPLHGRPPLPRRRQGL